MAGLDILRSHSGSGFARFFFTTESALTHVAALGSVCPSDFLSLSTVSEGVRRDLAEQRVLLVRAVCCSGSLPEVLPKKAVLPNR